MINSSVASLSDSALDSSGKLTTVARHLILIQCSAYTNSPGDIALMTEMARGKNLYELLESTTISWLESLCGLDMYHFTAPMPRGAAKDCKRLLKEYGESFFTRAGWSLTDGEGHWYVPRKLKSHPLLRRSFRKKMAA